MQIFVSQQLLFLFSKCVDTMSNATDCDPGQTNLWVDFIIIPYFRLYTGPKDEAVFNILAQSVYKNVMENNIDLKSTFNQWEISKKRTLTESRSAYFSDTKSSALFSAKWACKVR